MQENELLRLIAMIMVLFLIAPGFLYYTRQSGKRAAFRNMAIWLIIGLVAAIGFALFGDFR